MGLGALEIRLPLPRHLVRARVLLDLAGREAVDLGGVQAEDLRAQGGRYFGVAVAIPQFGRNLESPERLDLVLRRAVPDRVGAPQDVVRPAVADEFSQCVGG